MVIGRAPARLEWALLRAVSAVLLPAALGCSACTGEPANGASGMNASSSTTAASSGGVGGSPSNACGGFTWGVDWPPANAPKREPVALEPLHAKPDCGPGCRMMTTRLNFANGQPNEFTFTGRNMVSRAASQDAPELNYVDLEPATEWAAPAEPPEPNVKSYAQTTMGADCFTKEYTYYDEKDRRGYICEVCAHTSAQRLLAFTEGSAGDSKVNMGQVASSSRYVVITRADTVYALDVADGSEHPIADSLYFVTEISIFEPYIVLPEADGDVHVVDVRDWSNTNVTNDPALQYMASSDGKRIAWIDFRYSPEQTAAEVVVYDIETKALTRVTETQSNPSGKFYPTVEGDWVAWMDDRDSSAVNASIDTPRDRFDIYGYNLATNQEVHLAGNEAGEITKLYPVLPQIHGGKLYVVGNNNLGTFPNSQLYEFLLP